MLTKLISFMINICVKSSLNNDRWFNQICIIQKPPVVQQQQQQLQHLLTLHRIANNFRYCNLSTVVAFNHNELWNPLTMNSLSVTSRMLWPSATMNCCDQRPQITILWSPSCQQYGYSEYLLVNMLQYASFFSINEHIWR